MSDAFLGRQALQLGMILGCRPPGIPPLDASSVIACLVKIPENSLLAQLHAMLDIGRSEQVMTFPCLPARVAPADAQITVDDLLAMPRDARQALADILLASLQNDGAV
jgi:hypothetical protein